MEDIYGGHEEDIFPVDGTWGGEMVANIHGNVRGEVIPFSVVAPFGTSGDQQQAIDALSEGLIAGEDRLTLKGVTGSGKTYTMAKIIEKVQRPTLILSHNKTLAAQLYREFKSFFPNNAVEYFVSTYDYYQPEAYVPGKDLYIEKDADINDEIDRLRLSASFSLMERRDVIVVSTVSCIYGLANPVSLRDMTKTYAVGMQFDHTRELEQLVRMQYERNDAILKRGNFRVRGDVIEICPSYMENAVRISLEWDEISSIQWFDPVSGEKQESVPTFTLYPAKQFVMPKEQVVKAIGRIKDEMEAQYEHFITSGKPLEAERIKTRVEYDMEMLQEIGYCSGIENYSRPLSNRKEGERPAVLLDYFPPNFLTFIDESHVTLPQVGAMYEGDRSRKMNLVEYGFRLPSALDNRPLKFDEFTHVVGQRVFVSATPGKLELAESSRVVEQVIRPTGLLDPEISVRPTEGQMENLYGEIRSCIAKKQRVLVTTLTKKMSEDLTDYLTNLGLKVRYLHSEIETIERVEILRDLRLGVFDVLVGINLLREGLDLPEVALVAILDADKIGFLRSETSLIQTIGRAARNAEGRVIMYADRMSDAMSTAIKETNRRRALQMEYNKAHGITPTTIVKAIQDIIIREKTETLEIQKEDIAIRKSRFNLLEAKERKKYIKELEQEMLECAKNLEFERAAMLRDEITAIREGRFDAELTAADIKPLVMV
ncbi:excinuclease ABC subunit UvrB [Parasphaerochaeta coccoides]|uniref:UvrABC system protein B n=1 Tax=Parasphaerochaeta coccoides (strain ATCC BAA-1237 / DSM 17374 / SPN1) TaxID=760011 RepID=F4GIN3_PARC1|nr:Excinuclease ABC subunit B [Parasphaerochaeta coccoides DSM 17374]